MLDQSKLNDMWWAGFCSKLIEHARHTLPGMAGSNDRTSFLLGHIFPGPSKGCKDCLNANTFKGLERETAVRMGPKYVALFEAGGDIAKETHGRNQFQEALKITLRNAFTTGVIDQDFMEWMEEKAERYGQPYQAPS